MAIIQPTGIERFFGEDEIIVSKTDPNGRIHYVNDTFIRVSGFTEAELIGAPHSIIRHPGMPRGVFKLLWDVIMARREIFAFVMNMSKNGDHYWVYAHVTPTFGPGDQIVGFHSNRRVPNREALSQVIPLYQKMMDEERRHERKTDAAEASVRLVQQILSDAGKSYDEFVWSLENQGEGAAC
jgi:PAS domain S-box-containing protein